MTTPKMNHRPTQNQRLLLALSGRDLTTLEIITQLGIIQVGARICELRQDGWEIQTEMGDVKNRFGDPCRVARYHLPLTQQQRLDLEGGMMPVDITPTPGLYVCLNGFLFDIFKHFLYQFRRRFFIL